MWVRHAAFALLLATAFCVPRLLALRGVRMSAMITFEDMPLHLAHLDTMVRSGGDDEPFRGLRPQWPVGVYHVASPWARLLGPLSLWTTLLTNLVFTVALVLGLLGLGRALGEPRVGRWGALLAVLSPPLVASSWYFSLDYPLVAMTTVGLYLLWRTEGFARLWPSVALGVWSALGLFVKPTYAFYLAGPGLWVLGAGLWRSRARARVALHLLVCVGLTVLLFVVLYRPDLGQIWSSIRLHLVAQHLPGAAIAPWTLAWLTAYAKFTAVNYPWPLLLLALPGVVLLHRRGRSGGDWLLLVALWSTYLVLTLVVNKMERYVQPLYPLLCLLSVYWIVRWIPRRWTTVALCWLAAAFGAVLWITHARPIPWLPARLGAAPTVRDVRMEPGAARLGVTRESVFHPFRYEFVMPGRQRLERLRRWTWDADCQLAPVVEQLGRMIRARTRPDEPVGVACLTGAPYSSLLRVVPPLLQTLPERTIARQDLFCWDELPRPLLHLPALLILHDPARPPRRRARLRVVARQRWRVSCQVNGFALAATLARPAPPPSAAAERR